MLARLACCGDPNEGVTMLHCKECNVHLAAPFSCKTRICPSCANRRAEDVAEKLSELLPAVPYRHLLHAAQEDGDPSPVSTGPQPLPQHSQPDSPVSGQVRPF